MNACQAVNASQRRLCGLLAEHTCIASVAGNSLSNAILLWMRGTVRASLVAAPVQQRSTTALQARHRTYPHMPQNRHGWRLVREAI